MIFEGNEVVGYEINQNNKYPCLYPGNVSGGTVSGIATGKNNFYPQDKYLVDMSYLRMKNITFGYTLPQHITKKSTINLLKDGDIIVILSKTDGLDASHLAIVHFVDGKPHIIHASTLHGKVTLENITLSDYLKRHARTAPGIRILRVRD